jgi:hypothetical protein
MNEETTMFTYCNKVIIICIVVLVGIVVLAAGCGQDRRAAENNSLSLTGSGNIIAREVALTGFDRLEAGLTFDLLIRQGEAHRVRIFADDNFIDFIQVEQTGTTLTFGLKPGYAYDIAGMTMRAEVTMPVLTGLQLDSSSHAQLDGLVNQEQLEAKLTGASFLNGQLEGDGVYLKVDGSAAVVLAGSAQKLGVDACGSAQVDVGDFSAESLTLDAGCASRVKVDEASGWDGRISQNAQLLTARQ